MNFSPEVMLSKQKRKKSILKNLKKKNNLTSIQRHNFSLIYQNVKLTYEFQKENYGHFQWTCSFLKQSPQEHSQTRNPTILKVKVSKELLTKKKWVLFLTCPKKKSNEVISEWYVQKKNTETNNETFLKLAS
jgi:hypothetical protein